MPNEERQPNRGQNLLISAAIGVIAGVIGFAAGWFGSRQEESLQQIPPQSKDDHERWVRVIQRMEEQVDKAEGYECVVCFQKRRNVIFDCDHLVTCDECAGKLNHCPMCRARIYTKQAVRLYT